MILAVIGKQIQNQKHMKNKKQMIYVITIMQHRLLFMRMVSGNGCFIDVGNVKTEMDVSSMTETDSELNRNVNNGNNSNKCCLDEYLETEEYRYDRECTNAIIAFILLIVWS